MAATDAALVQETFGTLADGSPVLLFTLRNRQGMQARIASLGGTLVSLSAPDRLGHMGNVVLAHDTLDDYLGRDGYLGALIGRYANRIAGARFSLDGEEYHLAANEGAHCLHGGSSGLDRANWIVTGAHIGHDGPVLSLAHESADGDQGFPGKLALTGRYTLLDDNTLRLQLEAATDRATVVNLTAHPYFNLRGHGNVLGHEVQVHAGHYAAADSALLPTGEWRPVTATPFDLRAPKAIGACLRQSDAQLALAGGFDHGFVLEKAPRQFACDALVHEPESGRVLEVWSNQPCLQLYTANGLGTSVDAAGAQRHGRHAGLCLEPQHFADSPNQPHFPSTVLRPGERWTCAIEFRFSVR